MRVFMRIICMAQKKANVWQMPGCVTRILDYSSYFYAIILTFVIHAFV